MCIVHAQTNMNTGSSASSSSEYTNSGILESYFNNLAGFRFDEAKDKRTPEVHSLYCLLMLTAVFAKRET